MIRRMPKLRQSRGLLLLGVCLLLLGLLPVQSTLAAFKNLPIDNTLPDFARGTFQRASLGAVRIPTIPNQKLADENGAVQLGPIGLLRNWKKLASVLPSRLGNMGTASIGTNMYVIGGIDPVGNYKDTVYSAAVDTTNGQILSPGWQTEPSLAAVRGSNDLPAPPSASATVSAIASPAVAAVAKPGGGGYLYVIGGEIPQNLRKFSSFVVQRATVGTDGRIAAAGWADLGVTAQIPSPDPNDPNLQKGLLGASAQVFTTPNGRTFIYLIGGLQEYLQINTIVQQGTRQVWYTEVNVSTGALSNPAGGTTSAWAPLADIPLPNTLPSNAGLWNTAVVADHFLHTVNGTNDALYVIGGLNIPSTFTASQQAYRALINPTSGALTWTPKVSDGTYYTLPEARAGEGAAIFRGNIYLTSGLSSGSTNPDTSVLTTYVEDNLDLHNFSTGAGSDFLESTSALDFSAGNPGSPRQSHGSILIQAGPAAPNTAFLYMVGGRGATGDGDTTDDQGSDSIEMAKIGGDEDIKNTGYAPTGVYYSATYPIVFDQAQLQQISWATLITRTTGLEPDDIALDYRISSDADCTRPSWTDANWVSIDGAPADSHSSINGQNTVDLASAGAHCFQYRVTMTSSTDLKQTPSLLNVSIRILVPGGPDLKVQSIAPITAANKLTGLNVIIQNNNLLEPPTLGADTDSAGSFFVDLCISGPDAAAPPQPTLPLSPSNVWSCDKAYANVEKSAMGPNSIYSVTQWYSQATQQPVNILTFFATPGSYTVMVAVDAYVEPNATAFPKGYVDEGDVGGEANNVSQPVTFTVTAVSNVIVTHVANLPLARR